MKLEEYGKENNSIIVMLHGANFVHCYGTALLHTLGVTQHIQFFVLTPSQELIKGGMV